MAKFSTMYNYVDKFISKNSTDGFRDTYNNRIRAFLYMNISNKRDADEGLYEEAQELFESNQEFKDLVISCLGNMKRVYANDDDNKCDFDGIYKFITKNPNSNLDRDSAFAASSIEKRKYDEEKYSMSL